MGTDTEVLARAGSVEGWLTEREGLLLYRMAKRCTGKGVIVEIGSWKGRSTIFLALGSLAGARVPVYAIDPHNCAYDSTGSLLKSASTTTLDAFRVNVQKAGVEDIIRSIVRTSSDAVMRWDRPIELLWIDGDHGYEAVRLDIEQWGAHLIDRGMIAFHDSTPDGYLGVRKAVTDCILSSRFFTNVGVIDTVTHATKSQVRRRSMDSVRVQCLLATYRLFDIGRAIFPRRMREPLRTSAHGICAFLRRWIT